MYKARSEYRSSTESKNPPKRVTWSVARATRPSTISNRPAPITTSPAARNSPSANNQAAQILIRSPRKVSTFGWIFESASHRTMRLIIAPKNLPIAPVNVMRLRFVNRGQPENLELLQAARALYLNFVADRFVEKR